MPQWAVIQRFAMEGRRLDNVGGNSPISSKKAPLSTVVERLKERMPEVCEALMRDRPRQVGRDEWRYGKKGSLKVMVVGAKQGSFINFETGEKGGVLQLIATQKQCDLATAITWARQFVGADVSELKMSESKIGHSQRSAKCEELSSSHCKRDPKTSQDIAPETLSRWISLIPPLDAVSPPTTSPELRKVYRRHKETARYTYTNAEGHPLCYVVRFEPKEVSRDGASKMTLPLSYGKDAGEGSSPKWRYTKYRAASGEKTPLYNLKALNAQVDAPILIVEGEKTAEAAQILFPEMVVMTWQGGVGAVHHSDWTVLKNRSVVIWADHDTAGIRAAETAKEVCLQAGASQGGCVSLEFERGVLPQKWDLADALPEGITLDDIRGKVTDVMASFNIHLRTTEVIQVSNMPSKVDSLGDEGTLVGRAKDHNKEIEFDMD